MIHTNMPSLFPNPYSSSNQLHPFIFSLRVTTSRSHVFPIRIPRYRTYLLTLPRTKVLGSSAFPREPGEGARVEVGRVRSLLEKDSGVVFGEFPGERKDRYDDDGSDGVLA